jgi:hypothetical protein
MRYFGKDDPAAFMTKAQENPRQAALEVKSKLGGLYKRSMNGAHETKFALRSLVEFHEIPFREWKNQGQAGTTWENADRIIQETDEPYRGIFNFIKWSGLGEDEIWEIQRSQEIQRKIDAQRDNQKRYIRIQLSPRKSNLDDFFTLVLRDFTL